jgi:hypothetical protein
MMAVGTDTYTAFDAAGTFFDTGTQNSVNNVFRLDKYVFSQTPALSTVYEGLGTHAFDSLFPGATHVTVQSVGGNFAYYTYYRLSTERIEYVGAVSGENGNIFSFELLVLLMSLFKALGVILHTIPTIGFQRKE